MTEQPEQETFYEAIGGRATIELIVDVFYQGVAQDEVLEPMYPEEDLGPAAERLTMFLEQYWGGPNDLLAAARTPAPADAARALRRHRGRTRPLAQALPRGPRRGEADPEHDAQFWAYVQHAANFMVNSPS